MLTRLSVFRGGFDLEAAEQVAGASLPILAGLVDKSLIRLNADGRYDLHELLRQFAAEKLDQAGETAATAQRHLNYFLKLAEQAEAHVYGREQLVWFDRLEIELNNLRAALTWSINGREVELGLCACHSVGLVFSISSTLEEGLAWLGRLLALTPDDALSIRAKALHSAGELAGVIGDLERFKTVLPEALALARQVNDQKTIAWSLSALGFFSADLAGLGRESSHVSHLGRSRMASATYSDGALAGRLTKSNKIILCPCPARRSVDERP